MAGGPCGVPQRAAVRRTGAYCVFTTHIRSVIGAPSEPPQSLPEAASNRARRASCVRSSRVNDARTPSCTAWTDGSRFSSSVAPATLMRQMTTRRSAGSRSRVISPRASSRSKSRERSGLRPGQWAAIAVREHPPRPIARNACSSFSCSTVMPCRSQSSRYRSSIRAAATSRRTTASCSSAPAPSPAPSPSPSPGVSSFVRLMSRASCVKGQVQCGEVGQLCGINTHSSRAVFHLREGELGD